MVINLKGPVREDRAFQVLLESAQCRLIKRPRTGPFDVLCGSEDVNYFLADNLSIKVGLATAAVQNLACNHRVEGVIVANFYVVTCLNLGSALAHDNHTRASCLAVAKLNSEVLWVRVATVL